MATPHGFTAPFSDLETEVFALQPEHAAEQTAAFVHTVKQETPRRRPPLSAELPAVPAVPLWAGRQASLCYESVVSFSNESFVCDSRVLAA